jgi:hypothetical protein
MPLPKAPARNTSERVVGILTCISHLTGDLVEELRPRKTATDEIKEDPALMASLRRSEKDIEQGRTEPAKEVFDDLGW